jgi:predicted nucleotidyltransferase
MKRERAVALAENLLRNLEAGQADWPLTLVTEVYVFGSFARGALEPHDLDIDVEMTRNDARWTERFLACLSDGRDLFAPIKRPLTAGRRGYQFQFEFRERADFEMTLLWKRGDSLDTAMERLRAIKADATAGRALRDAMLPEFEGIDDWIPRPYREALCGAVDSGAIQIERVVLPDGHVTSPVAAEHIDYRWKAASPLYRAATAVVSHLEQRGIDPGQCHLHGKDIRDRDTPYFANFGLSHFRSIPYCLTEYGGVEWLEVVHPTKTRPLDCLRIVPLDKAKLEQARWG